MHLGPLGRSWGHSVVVLGCPGGSSGRSVGVCGMPFGAPGGLLGPFWSAFGTSGRGFSLVLEVCAGAWDENDEKLDFDDLLNGFALFW